MMRRISMQKCLRIFFCAGLGVLLATSLSLVGNSHTPQAHAAAAVTTVDPGDGSWVNLASMLIKRLGAADAVLPNGQVLMSGGYNHQAGTLSSAEIYNPTTNTWHATANMLNTHSGATATTLPDGQVLVAGGGTSAAELYNPTTNTWTATGSLTTSDSGATALLLGGNLGVLVVGGGLPTANLYNLSTGTWTATGPFSSLSSAGATLLQGTNSRVFVVGGTEADGTNNTGEIYDPTTNTWSATAPIPYLIANYHNATQLQNGQILVVSAYGMDSEVPYSAQLYDPSHDVWSLAAPLPYPMGAGYGVRLLNGKVMILGGSDPAGDPTNPQIYDPATNTWSYALTVGPGQNSAYVFYAANTAPPLLLQNGAVFEAGGIGETQANIVALANAYLPSGSWTAGSNFQLGSRSYATATKLANGDVLVAGGTDANYNALATAEIYNHTTGTWSAVASMNYARYGATSILLQNGLVLVFGGSSDTAELYSPVEDTWTVTEAPNIPITSPGASAALLPDGTVAVAEQGYALVIYNPQYDLWFPFPGANAPSTGSGPTLTTLADGRLLLVSSGGSSIYNPSTQTWTSTSAAPNASLLSNTLDTLLPNGNVLITGGGLALANPNQPPEIYNPTTDTWTQTPGLPIATTARMRPVSAVLLTTGQVLVIVRYTNNTALYDYGTNTWIWGKPMAQVRTNPTATLFGSDQVLVTCGAGASTEIFSL